MGDSGGASRGTPKYAQTCVTLHKNLGYGHFKELVHRQGVVSPHLLCALCTERWSAFPIKIFSLFLPAQRISVWGCWISLRLHQGQIRSYTPSSQWCVVDGEYGDIFPTLVRWFPPAVDSARGVCHEDGFTALFCSAFKRAFGSEFWSCCMLLRREGFSVGIGSK